MNHVEQGRLRLVFNDKVVVLSLAADATIGDVAKAPSDLAPRCYGRPVVIDVTVTDAPRPVVSPPGASPELRGTVH